MLSLLWLAAAPAAAQSTYRAPKTPDGQPDLNGIWQVLNTANWDIQGHAAGPGPLFQLGAAGAMPPGLGVVEGDAIPYLPRLPRKRRTTSRTGSTSILKSAAICRACRAPPTCRIRFRSCSPPNTC